MKSGERLHLSVCKGKSGPADVHVFEVRKNIGHGDCLFWSLLQALAMVLGLTQEKIRRRVVAYATDKANWPKFRESLVNQATGRASEQEATKTDDEERRKYRKDMGTAGNYGTMAELEIAGLIYNFNFTVLQRNEQPGCNRRWTHWTECPDVYNVMNFPHPNIQDGRARNWHYFRFMGNPNSGHWEYLEPISQE